jgi:peptidoglycan/LPS O-acetylase OafA/YrhL
VGTVGVPVFFLLSAYLITELLLRERDDTGRVAVGRFYIRRILRIWPLYFLVLLSGFGVAQLVKQHFTSSMLLWYLLLCGNWNTVLLGYLPLGLGALWSIGVEEQFYLIWPTIIRIGQRKAPLVSASVLYLASQYTTVWLTVHHSPTTPNIWANSLVQVQYFAIGIAISVLLKHRAPELPALARALLGMGSLGCFWCAQLVFNTSGHVPSSFATTYPGYLLTEVGAALLFFSVFGMTVPGWMRPFVYLGKISYGLYVFHPVLLMAVRNVLGRHCSHDGIGVLALAITIVTASLSYRFFETPFLKLKRRFEILETRPV